VARTDNSSNGHENGNLVAAIIEAESSRADYLSIDWTPTLLSIAIHSHSSLLSLA